MFFLGERPGWVSLIGAGLIIISGVLLQTLPQVSGKERS
jgi:drug/metabolite transporter (DMT)-like permease